MDKNDIINLEDNCAKDKKLVMNEFISLCHEIGKTPSEKDIQKYRENNNCILSKYKIRKYFKTLNNLNKICGFVPNKISNSTDWSENETKFLIDNILNGTTKEIATKLNRTESSIKAKKERLDLKNGKQNPFTLKEESIVTDYYNNTDYENFDLDVLSTILNRPKTSISRKANSLGLTERSRKKNLQFCENVKHGLIEMYETKEGEELKQYLSSVTKQQWANQEHPQGMLGKTHSDEYKEVRRKIMLNWWETATKEEITARTDKMVNTKVKKYHTQCKIKNSRNIYSNCKGGKRIDLNNIYFRSAWESNVARVLNLLSIKWEFEPFRFIFDNAIDSVHSYIPDFYLCDSDTWIEVKGIMDERSKIKLKKMKILYPNIFIYLIDEKEYKRISKQFKPLIDNWEGK